MRVVRGEVYGPNPGSASKIKDPVNIRIVIDRSLVILSVAIKADDEFMSDIKSA